MINPSIRTSHLLIFIAVVMQSMGIHAQSAVHLDIKSSPDEIGNRVISNISHRYYGWRYQKACTYYGALIFADATGDPAITREIQRGFKPYYDGKRRPHRGHVDYNVFGIWPFELYRQTGDDRYLKIARDLADDEYKNPGADGLTDLARFWVDDMYMVGSLQVQAYKSTGNSIYLDRAAHFLQVYVDTLQRSNGLFHHREDAPFYWGRGNGWAVAALTEVLLVLPEDHAYYASLLDAYQRMMITLASFQGNDGMWHQLIDDPASFPESSSTGMFLFGFISGVDKGWLSGDAYRGTIEKGWEALASYVNEKGEAMNVCIGTNAKNKKSHYLNRPKTNGNFHGQAAVLWASTALVRLMEGIETIP